MPLHTFDLDAGGSQTISILQGHLKADLTVLLNDRPLGRLTTPEERRDGRDFTLDDGSQITVRVVNKQVQVRHNGLRLLPTRPPVKAETPADRAARRTMLICTSIASIIVLTGVWLVVGNLSRTADPTTPVCLFKCLPGPTAPAYTYCAYRCATYPTPTGFVPPPQTASPSLDNSSTSALPDWLLLGGWVLPTLIACFVGVRHALVSSSRRWVAFGLLPALLLEVLLLIFLLSPFALIRFLPDQTLLLLILFYGIVFLVPVVCLVYARRLAQVR